MPKETPYLADEPSTRPAAPARGRSFLLAGILAVTTALLWFLLD